MLPTPGSFPSDAALPPSPRPITSANVTKANRLGSGRPRPAPPPHPDPARHDPQQHPLQPTTINTTTRSHSTRRPPHEAHAKQLTATTRNPLHNRYEDTSTNFKHIPKYQRAKPLPTSCTHITYPCIILLISEISKLSRLTSSWLGSPYLRKSIAFASHAHSRAASPDPKR